MYEKLSSRELDRLRVLANLGLCVHGSSALQQKTNHCHLSEVTGRVQRCVAGLRNNNNSSRPNQLLASRVQTYSLRIKPIFDTFDTFACFLKFVIYNYDDDADDELTQLSRA